MRTARMVSSFLKFNSTDTPSMRGKERYFNGFRRQKANLEFDPKWGEIRVNIVIILIFLALEVVHDPIGHGGSKNFP